MRIHKTVIVALIAISCALSFAALPLAAQNKPKLTLDEFFNSVDLTALELSPDGNSVVIGTERADWDQQIFRSDLWLYHDPGQTAAAKTAAALTAAAKTGEGPPNLIQLTQSGHDSDPKWSPDGRWIAFLSDRKSPSGKSDDSDSDADSDADSKDDSTTQLYLISPNGGEAFPITQGDEDVHAFAWSQNTSADSQKIYFSTRQPWTKSQKDDYKKDWKDVQQYRTAERGDSIFALDVAAALARDAAAPTKVTVDAGKEKEKEKDDTEDLTPGARSIASMSLRIDHLLVSPDGSKLAFLTNAINQRQEKYEDVELYVIDIDASAARHIPRRVTNNQAEETSPHWANDSRHIFFTVEVGDVSGPYRDLQPHLYWVDTGKSDTENPDDYKPDAKSRPTEQWSKDFTGPVDRYTVARLNEKDSILAAARLGTEVQLYSAAKPSDSLHRLTGWPGTYSRISTAAHSPRVAFVYSSLGKPDEVYLADSPSTLDQAQPITTFNHLFTERDLPQGKPYQWKADDGTTIEGMLIYPPGSFEPGSSEKTKPEAKHLPMLTLIHGGPADADGNSFAADWYDWAALAATNGWLVFRPNYRGSTGYGDKFLQQIVPQIVSRPGKDILEGVDALIKDGIADPDHLTIGGYSYGGYMTNWLITQTTRFKAAVTGAGAVEHIGNWGNDDTTYDDAYFLGGRPWEAPQRYHDEAAIFQIDKVKTPTHIVAGADDIRVAVLEDYLLEHALFSLGIPNKLLIFPGEGHSLAKNPWHGKIKVREELKWLQKYGGVPAQ
jgi:dipeptidyl aminopeptidase/acylaminoacyl peptidase